LRRVEFVQIAALHRRAITERRTKRIAGAEAAPTQTGRDLEARRHMLGRHDVFGRLQAGAHEILQSDGECRQVAPLFQHLIPQVERAVVIGGVFIRAGAVGRAEQLAPVAHAHVAKAAGQARGDLEGQRIAADRAEIGRGKGKEPIRLRLGRGHVDQAGGAVEVQRRAVLRHGRPRKTEGEQRGNGPHCRAA